MKNQRKELTAKQCPPKACISLSELNYQQAVSLTHTAPCMAWLFLPVTKQIPEC